jgi:small subunit ribosomal protein S16
LLRIRLARTGAKKKASYRIVVIAGEKARDGRFLEILGHYNPRRHPPEVVFDRDRAHYWIGRGAQPSETVQTLLKKAPEVPTSSVPTSSVQTSS